ncbi:AAA family ATPase [Sphingomonas koreensis]
MPPGVRAWCFGIEQQAAFAHIADRGDVAIVVSYTGIGRSAMLGVACETRESAGFEARRVALSGIAAGTGYGAGIASRTVASIEHQVGIRPSPRDPVAMQRSL